MSAPTSLPPALAEVVESLAAAPGSAIAPKPKPGQRHDALSLEFDDLYERYIGTLTELPPEAGLIALQALDTQLTAMAGAANAELWTASAIASAPEWEVVRELARRVLVQF